jgi:hypothetical protein
MKSRQKNLVGQHLLIFTLSLATPAVLYFNRHLDDNRLTSWNWVFDFVDLSRIGLMLGMALVLAWLLSSVSFYEKSKPLVLFVAAYVMVCRTVGEGNFCLDRSAACSFPVWLGV